LSLAHCSRRMAREMTRRISGPLVNLPLTHASVVPLHGISSSFMYPPTGIYHNASFVTSFATCEGIELGLAPAVRIPGRLHPRPHGREPRRRIFVCMSASLNAMVTVLPMNTEEPWRAQPRGVPEGGSAMPMAWAAYPDPAGIKRTQCDSGPSLLPKPLLRGRRRRPAARRRGGRGDDAANGGQREEVHSSVHRDYITPFRRGPKKDHGALLFVRS